MPHDRQSTIGMAVSSSQRNIMVKFQIDTWGESGCRVDTGTTHDG